MSKSTSVLVTLAASGAFAAAANPAAAVPIVQPTAISGGGLPVTKAYYNSYGWHPHLCFYRFGWHGPGFYHCRWHPWWGYGRGGYGWGWRHRWGWNHGWGGHGGWRGGGFHHFGGGHFGHFGGGHFGGGHGGHRR